MSSLEGPHKVLIKTLQGPGGGTGGHGGDNWNNNGGKGGHGGDVELIGGDVGTRGITWSSNSGQNVGKIYSKSDHIFESTTTFESERSVSYIILIKSENAEEKNNPELKTLSRLYEELPEIPEGEEGVQKHKIHIFGLSYFSHFHQFFL